MLLVPEIFNELNAIPRNWQVPSRDIRFTDFFVFVSLG